MGRLSNRPSLKLILLVALLLAMLPLLATVAMPPAPSDASARASPAALPRAIPDTDVNPYGANFFLEWEPESWKIERSFKMAQDAGIGWVKQQFPWEDLQLKPGPDGYWDDRLNKSTWEKYDRIVDLAHKYDLKIIARLDRPPKWSRAQDAPPHAPPDRFEDYGEFVYTFVKRYSGRIWYYQIWNEPNIYPEWGDQSPDASAYVDLLRIAYNQAKRADPNVRILSAPLAQTVEVSERNRSDLLYLEEMYQYGAKDYFDILFANAYGFAFPPHDPPDAERLNFARVTLLREIMVRNGDQDKAIWFNEFGWNASPEDFPADKLPWSRVSDELQAEYTIQAIEMAREEWPWAGVFCIWYFRQSGHIPADRSDYYFRMVDTGFTPRPLYTAIRRANEGVSLAGPGRYEETNPAAVFGGDWLVELRPDASGGAVLVSDNPGDSVTITFRGSDIGIYAERGPHSGTLYVTLDGRETNELPRDHQGRSYLDLYDSTSTGIVWVPISTGLRGDRHLLRMTVSATPNPQAEGRKVVIDGFAVSDDGVRRWGVSVSLVLVLALIGLAAGLSIRLRRRR